MDKPTGTGDLVKRARASCGCNIDSTPCGAEEDCRLVLALADALEAAERAFRLIADGPWPDTIDDPIGQARWDEKQARDWLARHATGQKGGDDE